MVHLLVLYTNYMFRPFHMAIFRFQYKFSLRWILFLVWWDGGSEISLYNLWVVWSVVWCPGWSSWSCSANVVLCSILPIGGSLRECNLYEPPENWSNKFVKMLHLVGWFIWIVRWCMGLQMLHLVGWFIWIVRWCMGLQMLHLVGWFIWIVRWCMGLQTSNWTTVAVSNPLSRLTKTPRMTMKRLELKTGKC